MLTFLHIMYSKNRTEAWGYCASKKKQERYKKCWSHDDQSWHVTVREWDSNYKRIYVLKSEGLERLFFQLIKEKLTNHDKFPQWTTTYNIESPFLSPQLEF